MTALYKSFFFSFLGSGAFSLSCLVKSLITESLSLMISSIYSSSSSFYFNVRVNVSLLLSSLLISVLSSLYSPFFSSSVYSSSPTNCLLCSISLLSISIPYLILILSSSFLSMISLRCMTCFVIENISS